MIDVYVLFTSDWDECGSDAIIWGVFSTKEEAEEYRAENKLDDKYFNVIIERHRLKIK